jgi:hypothetical protein
MKARANNKTKRPDVLKEYQKGGVFEPDIYLKRSSE